MSARYVICPAAVLAAGDYAEANNLGILDALTNEVKSGNLVFPAGVAAECKKLAGDTWGAVWCNAVEGHLTDGTKLSSHLTQVIRKCPEVADNSLTSNWQANPEVAALAVSLRESGSSVTIVTNDIYGTPNRMALKLVASHLGFAAIDAESYIKGLP